ncbi:MAG: hypothetical protein ACODAA_06675, partial [Gemmatimonadota bacterium]
VADELEADEMHRYGGHIESAAAADLIADLRRAGALRLADDERARRVIAAAVNDAVNNAIVEGWLPGPLNERSERDVGCLTAPLARLDRYLAGEDD